MTLEQQIQPLVTQDIQTFFPAMGVRIGLSAVRHFGHLWHFAITRPARLCQ